MKRLGGGDLVKTTTAWQGAVRGVDPTRLVGITAALRGDASRVYGEASPGLYGDVSGLQGCLHPGIYGRIEDGMWGVISPYLLGDLTGLRGDLTGLEGDVTHLHGTINTHLWGMASPRLCGNLSHVWGTLRYTLSGDLSTLRGDLSGIWGDIHPQLCGDVSGLRGNITGLWGDASGLHGNCTTLPADQRPGPLARVLSVG